MKLAYQDFDFLLSFSQGYANELVIENKDLFRRFVSDLATQSGGQPGIAVLSLKNTPVDFGKHVELCTHFAPFTLNRKTLLTKLLSAMEKQAVDAEHYVQTQSLLSMLESFADDLSQEYTLTLQYQKLSVGSILKSMGIEIEDPDQPTLETILDYMELVRDLDRDRLFIMINMRCYFSDDEMTQWVNSVCSHDFKLLLVESTAYRPLPDVKRYLIDGDLCEIY